jgi:hypothetical protein
MGYRIGWSAREKPIVEAAIRALFAGKYGTPKDAARACFGRLMRLRRQHPDARSRQASKTLDSTYYYIRNRIRGKWPHGRLTAWTEAENRVMRHQLQRLLHGRYLTAAEAARACIREFERLRMSDRSVGRSWVPRTESAVCTKMAKDARKAGRGPWRVRYTKAEMGTFDRYARAMAEGRYPNLTPAVILCRRDLARMRARCRQSAPPPRPFEAVRRQICRRVRNLGWSWSAKAWRAGPRTVTD